MLLVPSICLDNPTIEYGNKTQTVEWSWNLRDMKFYRTQKKKFKILVLIEKGINASQGLQNFLQFAQHNYGLFNTKLERITRVELSDPTDISKISSEIESQDPQPDLVLLILNTRNVEAYSRFKSLVDRTSGCHSICMTKRTFCGRDGTTMGNIMMKANLKCAGSNHTIQNGDLKRIMTDTLVLGADVTHPSGGSIIGCPSIAAIVGSVDDHAGRFLGSMRLQSAGKKEASTSVSSACHVH